MKKIIKGVAITMAIIGALIAIGVVGEQDREYFADSHQPYAPKAQFINFRR